MDEKNLNTERRSVVTNAVIDKKLAVIIEKTTRIQEDIHDIKNNNKIMEKQVIANQIVVSELCTKVATNKSEVDSLRKKSDTWGTLNSLAIVIGTWFGINK